ncbi:MAG TPA: (d)CMP kinase [Pyrinomonadaceae bacterium]|jgi:cytidylate kinase|nr:(d)CMP kinase [Pyrinomonadaceae bacterium]
MIIAIDGPSGSGKSTLGRLLARALKLLYIDTGSMYRAVALAVIEAKIDPGDNEAVTALANRIEIDLEGDPDSLKVWLDGRDVTDQIRTESVTAMSSIVSSITGVRRAMVERQRAIGKRGAVLNGRDIGTVVFPDADFKFFLTAVPEERAERRYKEDQMTSISSATLAETLVDMMERDRRDSTRADSPLKVADDAVVIDSTGKSIDDVLREMMERIGHGSHG